MMGTFYYLLEANLYLLIFFCFYKLLLRGETFYSLNRVFLLSTTVIAFILPFFQIGAFRPAEAGYQLAESTVYMVAQPAPASWTIPSIATVLYTGIAAVLLLRLCIRLYKIARMIRTANRSRVDNVNHVDITGSNAFSFFNYLFIDPGSQKSDIILKHEMVHIRQWHSADNLFFELVFVANWFNPLTLVLKKEIKAIHEFIADQHIIRQEADPEEYARFLISCSSPELPGPLASQLSGKYLLEERIIRLYKNRSANSSKLKYLALFPLLLLLISGSTLTFSKEYYLVDLLPPQPPGLHNPEVSKDIPALVSLKESDIAPAEQDIQAKATFAGYRSKKTPRKELPRPSNTGRPPAEEEPYAIWINATTDTVRIRRAEPNTSAKKDYKGIYVIDNQVYTHRELRNAMEPSGKLDIILDDRPMLVVFTENDENAISRWGEKAAGGVIIVQPKPKPTGI